MKSLASDQDFWTFSMHFYALPGVAAACVALQDKGGVDVNLLLFAVWSGMTGCAFRADQITAADDACRSWRDGVIIPLRTARRTLKMAGRRHNPAAAAQLRTRIGEAEIEAERLQQLMLAASVSLEHIDRPQLTLVFENLDAYCIQYLGLIDCTDLEVIRSASQTFLDAC
ncbi:TIGR02444 family protein [Beijerinckia sp. L45]|uniref:TIGR02444 family protein n=1 Tax=Beijerinckia sp. L45 TaxID=1641855 RepID=UPI0021105367|nr:TIGR02444 family protein [Beijerinckia sp. L45]